MQHDMTNTNGDLVSARGSAQVSRQKHHQRRPSSQITKLRTRATRPAIPPVSTSSRSSSLDLVPHGPLVRRRQQHQRQQQLPASGPDAPLPHPPLARNQRPGHCAAHKRRDGPARVRRATRAPGSCRRCHAQLHHGRPGAALEAGGARRRAHRGQARRGGGAGGVHVCRAGVCVPGLFVRWDAVGQAVEIFVCEVDGLECCQQPEAVGA